VQDALDEILAWVEGNPAEFERLLEDKWLGLFESASVTNTTTNPNSNNNNNNTHKMERNPTEEWLTKLWFACGAGEYTVSDLTRGRPFAGMRGYAFEGMHLRRLVAAQRPFHASGERKCACPRLD
jgi:hypothetical protein